MNAQEEWKSAYKLYRLARQKFSAFYETDELGAKMFRYRREAALERIIARQERTIRALREEADRWYDEYCKQVESESSAAESNVTELEAAYDRMRDTVMDLLP